MSSPFAGPAGRTALVTGAGNPAGIGFGRGPRRRRGNTVQEEKGA